jgi:PAS domain S-box-containing protein
MSVSIMVVEDEILIAKDIQRVLTDFGYEVFPPVASGNDALRAAEIRVPDLVLMDVTLKGPLDGIQTATQLRQKFQTPVVYLTSHADEATLARAKETDPYGFIIKPFTDRGLRTSIEVALSKHELEAKLAARERWFSTTLGSIGDAVIATDHDEVIRFMNAVAETLTGWRASEAIGHKLGEVFKLVASTHRPVARGSDAPPRGFAAMVPRTGELLARDGHKLLIDDSTTAIKDEQGAVIGGVVVFRDITDRVKMEKRLALSERLAAVGTMAAGIAHEINNPLAYITLNVLHAIDTLPTVGSDGALAFQPTLEQMRDVRAAIEEAHDGCERVRNIVQGLRRFARVEDSVRTLLDLPDVLAAAVQMTAHAVRHQARLRHVYGTTPFVEANEGQLVQVFLNLLVNAYQSLGEGSADVHEIRIVTFTDAGGRAVVEIHDTGRGIPRESLVAIFDPFFTTKAVGEGTGMGLSICHGIVTSLGGRLTVESEVGKGSIFRVMLPAATRGREESPPAAVHAAVRRGRILVLDDEVAIGNALSRVLSQEHSVTVEKDAREALARIAQEDFDVILCDLMMPKVSGIEFYETLAKSNPEAARRIVFMTGDAYSPRSQAFLDSVANVSVAKPFDMASVRVILRDFLR